MNNVLTNDARQRLKWTKVRSNPVDISYFPDFLIIGPQRTGTSWLFSNLRLHHDIMMPHIKEVLFFNRLKEPDNPKFRSNELEWYLGCFRDPVLRAAAKNAYCLWHHRRFYSPVLRGEASASYAALDPDIIDEVVAIKPGIKVILMIRDPIDRAWSHAIKDLVRDAKRKIDDVDDAEFEAFFRKPYQMRCARYVANHDNWASRLQPGNLLVGAFDDIASRPEVLLRQIMDFLGVNSDQRYIGRLAREVVNPTGGQRIPERWRAWLLELLAEEREKTANRFQMNWE